MCNVKAGQDSKQKTLMSSIKALGETTDALEALVTTLGRANRAVEESAGDIDVSNLAAALDIAPSQIDRHKIRIQVAIEDLQTMLM